MYLTLKWLHLAAAISWMAGILYLYRLLIYRAERGSDPKIAELLDLMAHRLCKYITMPAMTVTLIAGLAMPFVNEVLWRSGWFHAKMTLLVLLIGSTHYAKALVRKFAAGQSGLPTGKRLRVLNEIPTVLMLLILALAVFRPF